MLQSNIEPTDNTKKILIFVFRSETSKFHMILLRIQNFLPPIMRNRNLLLLIKNNKSTSDQASELSTLDTNIDKSQSMMELNNSTLKSEILYSFKTELNDITSNNNALSLKNIE